jgi:hypothetical protein
MESKLIQSRIYSLCLAYAVVLWIAYSIINVYEIYAHGGIYLLFVTLLLCSGVTLYIRRQLLQQASGRTESLSRWSRVWIGLVMVIFVLGALSRAIYIPWGTQQ